MTIGEKIKIIRTFRGMTQKELGIKIGYSEKTADVRIAQYESNYRTPSAKKLQSISLVLNISPLALSNPDITTYHGLMHTLFSIEDKYGLEIKKIDDELCLTFKGKIGTVPEYMRKWFEEYECFQNGESSKQEYDEWRYSFPRIDIERTRKALDENREKRKERQKNDL